MARALRQDPDLRGLQPCHNGWTVLSAVSNKTYEPGNAAKSRESGLDPLKYLPRGRP